MSPPSSRPLRWSAAGFSLANLVMAGVLIAVVSSVLVRFNAPQWRRTQVNAAALSLSEWLEEVSISPERDGQVCQVTISTGHALAPGSTLASVSPASCATRPVLQLDSMHARRPFTVGATATSFSFTPRGAVSTQSGATAASTGSDLEVRLSVEGQAPLRCVRVFGTLGLIRVARNNASGNPDMGCSELSRI